MATRDWNVAVLSVAMLALGCTHTQLRRNTVNQMSTVHELQQQQVLDNLAMFVQNRNAYPYYSVVTQGTSQLSDSASLAILNGFGRTGTNFLYNTLGINPSAQRQATEAWTINPVNDSVKLTLMRCIYRRAVEGCLGPSADGCPDCEKLFAAYYLTPKGVGMREGAPSGSGGEEEQSVPWPGGPPNPIPEPLPAPRETPAMGDGSAHDDGTEVEDKDAPSGSGDVKPLPHVDGIVTPYCLNFRPCWFCWGPKPPKHWRDKCCMVGHYCGTYVWVPDEGRDELTKVTLLIQDVAFYEPPSSPSNAQGGGGGAAGRSQSVYPYTTLGALQILRAFTPPSTGALP